MIWTYESCRLRVLEALSRDDWLGRVAVALVEVRRRRSAEPVGRVFVEECFIPPPTNASKAPPALSLSIPDASSST